MPSLDQIIGLGLPIVVFLLVLYLFVLRPEKKRQKEVYSMQTSIQKNDKVVTVGGIHGIIDEVKDDYFVLMVSSGARMKIERGAVKRIIKEEKNVAK